MKILVTGGAGYIGSHTCVLLLQAGYDLVVLDNLINSSVEALQRVKKLAGRDLDFVQGDLADTELLRDLFQQHDIDAVIHFAGLKAVGESVSKPLLYYQNNISGSLNLFAAMAEAGVQDIIFSSSATVYGDPETVPITEDFPTGATNPYGETKLMLEHMLRDLTGIPVAETAPWRVALLRYFNPVGAHPSGDIGEDPLGIPNNLVPYIAKVAVGELDCLQVFGSDYPTADGTGVRDYIHVMDLADGHLKALLWLKQQKPEALCEVFNLGTGQGYSVLEVVQAFERACGKAIPYKQVERRPGDVAICYADPAKARAMLGWQADSDLNTMMADTWRWQSQNPRGYRT